ncbi:type III secretion apparatus protein [Stigmatella sp. ncwal1]|uniref:Type III secretion apparatus protein n=1 Tax=Stigmatella ashevillensis TaxID=2995309 RepID=A0ABT5DBG6_9BACT|nr:type III secretion apparatus protein [Stigmatella ashevillena]MDC0709666.1 type III secretion apparatus protein [Stigmatella ashevillena]
MAIDGIGSVGGVGGMLPQQVGRERFSQVLEATKGTDRALAGAAQASALVVARVPQAEQMLDRVGHAQRELDHLLAQAESGRSFSPRELLAFQARVYRASQEVDLAGKGVEKATSGVKQILQTQV